MMDLEQIAQLKVAELKEELKKRGLPLKGLKAELAERLAEAVRQEVPLPGKVTEEEVGKAENPAQLNNADEAREVEKVGTAVEVKIDGGAIEVKAVAQIADQQGVLGGAVEAADQGAKVDSLNEKVEGAQELEAKPMQLDTEKEEKERSWGGPIEQALEEKIMQLDGTEEKERLLGVVAKESTEGALEELPPVETSPQSVEESALPVSEEEPTEKGEDVNEEIRIDKEEEPTAEPAPETPSEAPVEQAVEVSEPQAMHVETEEEKGGRENSNVGLHQEGDRAPGKDERDDQLGSSAMVTDSSAIKEEPVKGAREGGQESGVKRAHEEDGSAQNGREQESRPAKLLKLEAPEGEGAHVSRPSERRNEPDQARKAVVRPTEQQQRVKPSERAPARGAVWSMMEKSNGEKRRDVPASARPATRSVRVNNLVRPFTEKALRSLLNETGTIEENGFWMDSIKTHCYVTFKSVDEAVRTREALYNLQWPPLGGRLLVVRFVPDFEVEGKVKAAAVPPPSRGVAREEVTMPGRGGLAQRTVLSVKERLTMPPAEKPRQTVAETPVPSLDDLFRKTLAKPCIYWIPLTEEQVEQRKLEREKAIAPLGK